MKTDDHQNQGHWPSTLIALFLVVIGVVAWIQTYDMGDADSYVFPRVVILSMVMFSIILIIRNLVQDVVVNNERSGVQSSWRRIGLVVILLIGVLAVPRVGFVISGLFVFGGAMVLAMYDPWTWRRRIVYPLTGATIVLSFYLVFSEYLFVSFPSGTLFK